MPSFFVTSGILGIMIIITEIALKLYKTMVLYISLKNNAFNYGNDWRAWSERKTSINILNLKNKAEFEIKIYPQICPHKFVILRNNYQK